MRKVKPVKLLDKKWGESINKSDKEGEFNQSTLCACMEISQCDAFV
jgi:hypothetical protein